MLANLFNLTLITSDWHDSQLPVCLSLCVTGYDDDDEVTGGSPSRIPKLCNGTANQTDFYSSILFLKPISAFPTLLDNSLSPSFPVFWGYYLDLQIATWLVCKVLPLIDPITAECLIQAMTQGLVWFANVLVPGTGDDLCCFRRNKAQSLHFNAAIPGIVCVCVSVSCCPILRVQNKN